MAKKLPYPGLKGVIPAIILFIIFFAIASVYSKTGSGDARSDIIMIDMPAIPGGEQMPAVRFLHDKHTQSIQKKQDCSVCHIKKDDRFVFKFKRIEDGTTEIDMAVYHEYCIACHAETRSAGRPAGPIAGECRSCHNKATLVANSWQPIAFNKSLHYRHESATFIKPLDGRDSVNCSACHHKYDQEANKTFYAKGQEESCRYCHEQIKTEQASSIRTASHGTCVVCHRQLADQQKKSGPIDCAGCHSGTEQAKIEQLAQVPRIKRNQPDAVLLASWMNVKKVDQKTVAKQMRPVAFDHKTHEQAQTTCKSCHHKTLKRCAECHMEIGTKEGGFVRLEQAMHMRTSQKSCLGCHKAAQREPNCSGCHTKMPAKPFVNEKCDLCHRVDKSELGSIPMSKEAKTELALRNLHGDATGSVKIPDDQVPEKVVIDIMADQYEGAVFPHRQIFRSLELRIKDNKMAAFFHNDTVTLCMGCHHGSPASMQPPKCVSCHSTAFNGLQVGRPGLKGAYHGQCITCHQVMDIKEPAATDCIKCHKAKK